MASRFGYTAPKKKPLATSSYSGGYRVRRPQVNTYDPYFDTRISAPGRTRYELNTAASIEGKSPAQYRAEAVVAAGGRSGQAIRDYQRALAVEGLYRGPIDGIWGPQTEAAAAAFTARQATRYEQMMTTAREQYTQQLIKQKAESIKARAEMLRIAQQAAKIKGLEKFAKTLRTHAGSSADDERNNLEALGLRDEARRIWGEIQREKNKKPGFFEKALGTALKFGGPALQALGFASEQAQQTYYAGQYARNKGAGTGTQLRAMLGAVPGLGFTASGSARRFGEATNTYEERARLTQQGQLASFGEVLSGRAVDKFKGEALQRYQAEGGGKYRAPGWVSPAADAAFQVGLDPLSYVSPLVKGLGLAAPMARAAARASKGLPADLVVQAQRAARLRWVQETATGRTLVRRIETAALRPDADVNQLTKLIKGLEPTHAREILATTSKDSRREVIEQILARGEMPFELGLRKQGLIKMTGGRLGTGEFAKASTLRNKGMQQIRRLSRGDAPRATGLTGRANEAIARAVNSGLRRTGMLVDDFYNDAIRPHVENLDISTRLGRLWDLAERAPVAAFRQATEEEIKRILNIAGARTGKAVNEFGVAVSDRTVSLNDIINGKTLPEEAERVLQRLEVAAELLVGESDDVALRQTSEELVKGFQFKTDLSIGALQKRAAGNLGIGLPKAQTVPWNKGESITLRARIMAGLPPEADSLQLKLIKALDIQDAKASQGKKVYLTKIRSILDLMENRPEMLVEASRLADNLVDAAGQADAAIPQAGIGTRFTRKLTGFPLALNEAANKGYIEFQNATPNSVFHATNRAEFLDRWLMEFGTDDFSRARLREAAAAARTEQSLFLLVKANARREMEKMGGAPELADKVLNDAKRAMRDGRVRFAAPDGTTTDELMTMAQKGELIPLPDPGDFKQALLEARAEAGELGGRVQNRLRSIGEGQILNFEYAGEAVSARRLLRAGHREWKFLVVTNLWAAPVGFAAGFYGGPENDASFKDRLLQGAQVGALFGATAPVRYLLRLVGIEEKMRTFLTLGGRRTATGMIPVYAKWARTHGIDLPYRFQSVDLIRGGNADVGHLSRSNRLLQTQDDVWDAMTRDFKGIGNTVQLGRKQTRFVDGWFRVLNYELHAETDNVAELLLREKAGQFTRQQVDQMLDDFLTTEDGAVWLNRITKGHKAPANAAQAIDRYRRFVDHYVPSPDLADARLAGEVPHKVLKELTKADVAPQFVHAQKTWILPKSFKQAFQLRNRVASQFVLEGPTTKLNRHPMAEWLYRDRFLSLTDAGVDPKRAQELADTYAARRTNEVMFNPDDQSRFAKKADYIFPFQQPREEMFRVWAKLIQQNPGRAMLVAENAAKALNAGEENGMFTKNPFTGAWELSVPTGPIGSLLHSVVGMEANLKDYLFVGQGAYGVNIIPSPGGPYWSTLARTALNTKWGQDLATKHLSPAMREILFPYGSDGTIMSRGTDRLWMAYTRTIPPWEFASKEQMQNVLDKHTSEVVSHLIWKHRQLHPEDLDWLPTPDEIDKAVSGSLRTWALMTNLNPAATRPRFIGEKEYQRAIETYKDPLTEKIDFAQMLKDRPELEPYVSRGGKTEWVGPDGWKDWNERVDYDTQRLLGYLRYKSGPETLAAIKEGRYRSKGHEERKAILANASLPALEKERAMWLWREKYPELADGWRGDYLAQEELATLLHTAPAGAERDAAIDRWRRHHDITPSKYKKMTAEIRTGVFQFDPWRQARDMEDVAKHVDREVKGKGFSEDVVVSRLAPAEQVRYWNWKKLDLIAKPPQQVLGSGEDTKLLDAFKALGQKQAEVFKRYGWSIGAKPKLLSPAEKALEKWRGDYRQAINDTYVEISRVRKAMSAAADRKDWTTYYALKPKSDALFDQVESLKNKQYREIPELAIMQEDVGALLLFTGTGSKSAVSRVYGAIDKGDGPFIPSNEVEDFLRKPQRIREAYIQDMADRLTSDWEDPNGPKIPGGGRLKWEYLTDFQKDLLEASAPEDMLNAWKTGTGLGAPDDGSGGGGRFGRRGGAGGELGFAIAMFKQYNKRPAGAKPPAAYAAYLKLPNDPVVRADFIKKHPEVGTWLKMGPMANMPPVLQMMVADIMIRNGKWEGESRTMQEITELAFAREQFARFNRRTGDKPPTYDQWVNMPSGPEKAAFLQAHPEIQQWIQLGPMANMPEEYREVVRDIMMRYGEWTQRDDPLGKTINEYYRLPSFAREKFLQEHPELLGYWAATRNPQESAMFKLADEYFAIQDVGAKRFFLHMHPELQGWFVDQRTKRYERFLNRVAVYMGQNPELFTHYLERQEDVLTELFKRFATPVFMGEVPRAAVRTSRASTGETGRKRQVAA